MIDPASCTACGLCVIACPADALADVGPSASDLVGAAVEAPEGLTVRCLVAGADREGRRPAFYVGCLGSVDPEALAASAVAAPVVLQHADCAACPVAPEEQVAAVMIAGARLAAALDGANPITEEPVPPSGRRAAPGRPRVMSRRALMSERTPIARASARSLLLDADASAPLPYVEVDASCTGCQACVRVCPTQALEASRVGEAVQLTFDARDCVGCGECTRVCADDAITVPGRRCGPHGPVVVASVEVRRCARCEAVLAPGEVRTCARCQGRRGMLDDVWGQLRS